jgi:hypothetical protein
LALGLMCLFLHFTHSIMWALFGLILGRLAVLLLWDSRLKHVGHFSDLP